MLKQILMSKGKEEDEMKTITTMYFSPTGTSRKISEAIADGIAGAGTFDRKRIDLTKPRPGKSSMNLERRIYWY